MTASLEQFEAVLRAHPPLVFPRVPTEVDWRALPPMVEIYRDMLLPGDLPVRVDVFAKRVAVEANWRDPRGLPYDWVYARAYRTYPSLVRQHHLRLQLEDSGSFDAVHWIPWEDYLGLDLLCFRESFVVCVALSTATAAAARWKRVKAVRHPQPAGLSIVELDADPSGPYIGPFFVHPPAQAMLIAQRMDDLIFSHRTAAIPNILQARAVFEEALHSGAFSGKPGWVANGLGFYWALVHDMRQRAQGQEGHPTLFEELA